MRRAIFLLATATILTVAPDAFAADDLQVAADEPPQEDATPAGLGFGLMLGTRGLIARDVRFEGSGEAFTIDGHLFGPVGGLAIAVQWGAFRPAILRLTGGKLLGVDAELGQRADRRASPPREVSAPRVYSAQYGIGALLDGGAVDIGVEATFAVTGLIVSLESTPPEVREASAMLLEGGASVSVRYSPFGCMFIEPTFQVGVAGLADAGVSYGSFVSLGCDMGVGLRNRARLSPR